MAIILRLQGLDVKAGTEDIRTFFEGLHIPDGGVYIVGGSLREAFIAFATERDAQRAMRYTGDSLKGSTVALHISSMAELEQKLKSLLVKKKKKKKKPSPAQLTVKKPQSSSDANVPPLNARLHSPNTANLPQPLNPDIANLQPLNAHALDSNTAFLLGVCTVLQGLQSSLQSKNNEAVPRVDFPKTGGTVVSEVRTQTQTPDTKPGYVRLFGLPASATKEHICRFFNGLTVQEAIVNVELGRSHVCLVKFANMQEACDALFFNQQSLGPIRVEVRGATEKMWTSALQECETAFDVGERVKPKQKNTPAAPRLKRQSVNRSLLDSPKKPRPDGDSITTLSPIMEYIVMVNNIPPKMTKTEIKELFGCPNITHTNVQYLLDKDGVRTDTAFLIFNRAEDYDYAMNLTGCHVGSDTIEVSSITRKIMWDIMAKAHHRSVKPCSKISNPAETPEKAPSMTPDPAAQTCLFVRNMPADVQESHIRRLFCKYKVRKDDVILLRDGDGNGIGEAVVQFESQKLAALAQRLHGLDFLGTEVLLTRINVKQMADILARNV